MGYTSSLAEAELWAGPGCTVGIQPVRGVDGRCSEGESGLADKCTGAPVHVTFSEDPD